MSAESNSLIPASAEDAGLAASRRPMARADGAVRAYRLPFALPLGAAVLGAAVGGWALFANAADGLVVPAFALLVVGLLGAFLLGGRDGGTRDLTSLFLAGVTLGAMALVVALPTWLFGADVNGIVHRTALSSPLLLTLAVLVAAHGLRGLGGATPSGQDRALYPVLALPVILALVAYALLLGRVVIGGLEGLRFDLLTTAWSERLVERNGIPVFEYTVGLRNHILGTALLVILTLSFAILPGVGTGVFLAEYRGGLARLVNFCTTMLRAVSVFVIGAAALSTVGLASGQLAGTPLSDLVRGVIRDGSGLAQAGTGSFIVASAFLALLVIPIIAKLTEEGLLSAPRDLREASVALGATDGYGLRRVLLPWASPNILTGVLLGAAEASGSLAVIMFMAGTGSEGVGPTSSVTSLDYALFATRYGSKPFVETMRDYQFTAALLLLLLTVGLTAASMLLRRRMAARRGGLSGG